MSEEIKEKETDTAAVSENEPAQAETAAQEAAETVETPAAGEKAKKPVSRVKGFVIGIIAFCVVIIGVLGWRSFKNGDFMQFSDKNAQETATFKGIDYAKLFKSHKADDVALSVSGSEFEWDEYFCWVYNMGEQILSYFKQTYSYYGVMLGWGDNISEDSSMTYFDVITSGAEDYLKQIVCVENAAAKNGITLDAQDEATIADAVAANAANFCGEGATEEDFAKYPAGFYMPLDFFKRTIAQNLLQDKLFTTLYGADCSLVTDEDALSFLEENGYMYANHILFLTTDAEGNALDDSAKAEKLEQANDVVEELRAISGNAKRVDRFKELKEELCEDTGKVMYPDGYTFTSGRMVASFEEGCAALSDYEISDPVESEYGYHVIIRLPLDPDAVIEYDTSTYQAINARAMVASNQFTELLQSEYDGLTVEYKPGFESLKFAKYLTKVS